jgi:hypothetical protein
MADAKKVEVVPNDELDMSEMTGVEVRGASGVSSYKADPMQDTVLKLVVVGRKVDEDGQDSGAIETVVAHIGDSEAIKAMKEAEEQARKDAEKAAKEAEQAAKEAEKPASETKEAAATKR